MILIGIVGFRLAGKFLKHAADLLALGWQHMFRAAVIAALLGIVCTEVVACVSTGQFPPPLLAQVVAAVLALVLAYCAALTVFIFELFAGSLDMIRMLMGDVEAHARVATATVGHEAGNVRDILRRLVGLRPQPARTERTVAAVTLPALASRVLRGRAPTKATHQQIQEPQLDDEELPLPPPRVVAQPVPASQLPRISWSYDEPVYTPSRPPVSPPPVTPQSVPAPFEAQPPMSPPPALLPVASPPVPAVSMTPLPETPQAAPAPSVSVPPEPSPVAQPLVVQPPVAPATLPREEPQAAPPAVSITEEWTHESLAPADDIDTLKRKTTVRVATAQVTREALRPIPEEQLQPRPTRPLGSTTRPISSTTRPLGRVTRPLTDARRLREASNSGGLWQRVSQVLVGLIEEPAEPAESPAEPTPPDTALPPEAEQTPNKPT